MRVKYNVDTQVVFQIGDPMDQGCATYLHNAIYEYANINAVNLPCVVPQGTLPDFIQAVKTINANGFDITTPHKTDIIPYLDECDEASRAFRCVNCVKVKDGKLIGIGLDGAGMGMSIQDVVDDLTDLHVLIVGAGAVAGPIAANLCTRGVKKATIINRTKEKSEYIAGVLQSLYGIETECGPFDANYIASIAPNVDLVVQCTSLKTVSDWENTLPLSFIKFLPKHCIVADVLYPTTAFLKEAASQGLKIIDGRGMLFYQQIAMMEFRFGIKLPKDVLLEAEEAVEIAIAMRSLRNRRLNLSN